MGPGKNDTFNDNKCISFLSGGKASVIQFRPKSYHWHVKQMSICRTVLGPDKWIHELVNTVSILGLLSEAFPVDVK